MFKKVFATVERIPLPQGFRAAATACGVRGDAGRLDLAVFACDGPCTAAGVFTQNKVCGAPVQVSRERVPSSTARAVVINSGNANACTGDRGLDDARTMAGEVAQELGCEARDVLICSTGVIGHLLPIQKIRAGIPAAVAGLEGSDDALLQAARAIMTTDTVPKLATRYVPLGAGKSIRLSGVCKGAAMIGPNMATMLSVIMTDARLSGELADRLLRRAVDQSFNCISVEGHTSTSDSVILLAGGPSAVEIAGNEDLQAFAGALEDLCAELARKIIQDAEGAEHLITIDVRGAGTREEAVKVARTIADDALVKTAITGADPNWGRIVSCVGRTGLNLTEREITLKLDGVLLFDAGRPLEFDAAAVSRRIKDNRDVHIELSLSHGTASVRFWTSDLTAEYVRLNSEYTT